MKAPDAMPAELPSTLPRPALDADHVAASAVAVTSLVGASSTEPGAAGVAEAGIGTWSQS